MSRDHLLACMLYSLGALLLCATNVFGQHVRETTIDADRANMKGGNGDREISFGSVLKSQLTTRSGVIYLARKVPDNGILYKTEAYFTSTDLIYLQVWRPQGSDSFKLIHQIEVQATQANVTESIYLIKNRNATPLECPTVRRDDRIGLYSQNGTAPIPYYYDPVEPKKYTRTATSLPHIGREETFDSIVFPYDFSIKCYMWKDTGKRDAGKFGDCPVHLMNDSRSTTSATVTTSTTRAVTATMTTPTTTTTTSTTTTTTTPTTTTTTPTTTTTTTTTTVKPLSVTGGDLVTVASKTNVQRPKVLTTAVGAVAVIAVVAIIIAIFIVVYWRRRRRQQEDSGPEAKTITPSNGYIEHIATDDSTPSTLNPAYGVSCDFLNPYEVPNRPRTDEEVPHVYHPIIPKRPVVATAPSGESPQAALPPSGVRPRTYEEIRNDQPRILIKPIAKTKQDNPARKSPNTSTALKPANKGWKLPGMAPTAPRKESTYYEDVGNGGSPTYLELLPDDADSEGRS